LVLFVPPVRSLFQIEAPADGRRTWFLLNGLALLPALLIELLRLYTYRGGCDETVDRV
jgi:hypothetical protein